MADTIAAIATGNALAAIGIVRLSGDSAIDVADRVFFPADGGRMSEKASRIVAMSFCEPRSCQ